MILIKKFLFRHSLKKVFTIGLIFGCLFFSTVLNALANSQTHQTKRYPTNIDKFNQTLNWVAYEPNVQPTAPFAAADTVTNTTTTTVSSVTTTTTIPKPPPSTTTTSIAAATTTSTIQSTTTTTVGKNVVTGKVYTCYFMTQLDVFNADVTFNTTGALEISSFTGYGFYLPIATLFTGGYYALNATIGTQTGDIIMLLAGASFDPFIAGFGTVVVEYSAVYFVTFSGFESNLL